ncbi:MAG: 30S ribosomal protein S2 [Patescibacteria group bacterium]
MKNDKKMLEELLQAACHFGHKVSKWNPKMSTYIYSKRDGVHIFDLTKTATALDKAMAFLTETSASGKEILIVSTKLHATKLVQEAAIRCGCPFVTQKWMPGLLTNFDTIRKRIKYFRDLKEQKAKGEWEKYTKKERVELGRVLEKLEDAFSGVENMLRMPEVVIVLDSVRDVLALREARKLKLATVGICDSNADPDLLAYPIPGNDDAIKSLRYFVGKLSGAIEEGKKQVARVQQAPREKVKPVASQQTTPVVQ